MRVFLLLIAAVCTIAAPRLVLSAGDPEQPYAGQRERSIKALSDEEIAALRNGEGMGLAKAAELNSYPGPRHVLDMARELHVSEEQVRKLTAVYRRMNTAARNLGAALIERERGLDRLFASGGVTEQGLRVETAAIADIQARLRAAHLLAHIETRTLLTADQVAAYDGLRGYAAAAHSGKSRSGGFPAGHRH